MKGAKRAKRKKRSQPQSQTRICKFEQRCFTPVLSAKRAQQQNIVDTIPLVCAFIIHARTRVPEASSKPSTLHSRSNTPLPLRRCGTYVCNAVADYIYGARTCGGYGSPVAGPRTTVPRTAPPPDPGRGRSCRSSAPRSLAPATPCRQRKTPLRSEKGQAAHNHESCPPLVAREARPTPAPRLCAFRIHRSSLRPNMVFASSVVCPRSACANCPRAPRNKSTCLFKLPFFLSLTHLIVHALAILSPQPGPDFRREGQHIESGVRHVRRHLVQQAANQQSYALTNRLSRYINQSPPNYTPRCLSACLHLPLAVTYCSPVEARETLATYSTQHRIE